MSPREAMGICDSHSINSMRFARYRVFRVFPRAVICAKSFDGRRASPFRRSQTRAASRGEQDYAAISEAFMEK